MLDSALSAPFQSFGETDFYPTTQEKAVRLAYGLVMNHPFHDGNKRIGAHVMLIFLELNGYRLRYSQEELIHEILALAEGTLQREDLSRWLKERIVQ